MNKDFEIIDTSGPVTIEGNRAVYRNESGQPQEIEASVTYLRKW